MLKNIFKSNRAKIIIPLLALLILLIGLFSLLNHLSVMKYKEQVITAEKHLEDGNYEEAIDAYIKAIEMKKSRGDREKLAIGLAESYAGINDYDKALETLREFYIISDSVIIKEKIEEITCERTDYEFQQIIIHADRFFSNEEYSKAIDEYEKAKKIKSRESISYQKIAEAYIKMEQYDKAYEEIMDGIALTEDEDLAKTLSKIEKKQDIILYDEYIEEASQYIYQENYEDGIKRYRDAIKLNPDNEAAYAGLAEVYITLNRYESAIASIEQGLDIMKSSRLLELLEKATELKKQSDKRKNFLVDLYNATNHLDVSEIESLMRSKYFQENIAQKEPIYYSQQGEGLISTGNIMIIYDNKSLYSGGIKEGMKTDMGIYFMITDSKNNKGSYYYEGEWNNNLPGGDGKTVETENLKEDNGEERKEQIVASGNYTNGLEHGWFSRTLYSDGEESSSVSYRVKEGVPIPFIGEEGNIVMEEDTGYYAIGIIYENDTPTNRYFYVDSKTKWGVKPYVK